MNEKEKQKLWSIFHRLWSNAKDSDNYNKDFWMDLQRGIERMEYNPRDLQRGIDPRLTVAHLVEQNISRAIRWHDGKISTWSALEWAGAMCGEAGEAANAAKKLLRIEQHIQSINESARNYVTLDEARDAVAKEACDTILYALLLLAHVGKDDGEKVEAILREVFNKKSIEYGFPELI